MMTIPWRTFFFEEQTVYAVLCLSLYDGLLAFRAAHAMRFGHSTVQWRSEIRQANHNSYV
ncbi:hypothetical protein AJ88_34900 [Mesorhizobium amorphae CCBAU 01583]|nr:hypothetical protein AJ88_34900 [Mesorhizobium amorphae CCBAU 01583]